MNNRHAKALANVAAALMILLFMPGTARSQTIDSIAGQLTYFRYDEDGTVRYVYRSQETIQEVLIPPDQCASISPSGSLLAVAERSGGRLKIIRLSDRQTLLEQAWRPTWKACEFTWNNDETLRLITRAGGWQVLTVTTRAVVDVPPLSRMPPTALPGQVPGESVILSPDWRYALYSQCSQVGGGDRPFCVGDAQVVLYDLQAQQPLDVLTDASYLIIGERADEMGVYPPNPPSVFWSPSGSYFLYLGMTQLRLYDMRARAARDIQLPDGFVFFALDAYLKWSVDESLVGFWVIPSRRYYPSESSLRFVEADVATGQAAVSPVGASFKDWRWSPDYSVLAVATSDGQLALFDPATGESEIIDEGSVYALIAWTK